MKVVRRTEIAATVMVAIVVCVACFAGCRADGADSDGNRPLFSLMGEIGFQGDADAFLNGLGDEQSAALDIAYEADATAGYQGSKADWAKDKLRGHVDGNGDLVVVLPDGGEFSVSEAGPNDGRADASHSAETERAVDGRSGSSGGSGGAGSQSGDSEAAGAVSRITVDNASAHPGEEGVTASLRIKGNPGIAGLTLSLSYDDSVLALKSADNGDAFRGVLTLTHSPSFESGCMFTWDGVDVPTVDARDGSVLTLRFDVSEKAAPGAYPLVVHAGSAFTNDLDEVALAIESGNLVVS